MTSNIEARCEFCGYSEQDKRELMDHKLCVNRNGVGRMLPPNEEIERDEIKHAHELKQQPFQTRVDDWMQACFGAEISGDSVERNHRFLEEALELVQSKGCTASEAHQLVDYVFNRPAGDPPQEVGGVMVTLAALCLAGHISMHEAGETELKRIWTKVEQIRAKQAAKPKHSPLPQKGFDVKALVKAARRVIEYQSFGNLAILASEIKKYEQEGK